MNKPVARISALSLSMLLFVGCATTSVAPTSSPAQQAAIALRLAEQVNRITLYKVLGGQWAGAADTADTAGAAGG